jgi:YhgE/Pip-like protein
MSVPEQMDEVPEVRAQDLLEKRSIWAFPAVVGSLMIMLMTIIYFGSIVDPTAHLHGLPVWIVNQDKGATTSSGRLNLGNDVVAALKGSPEVSTKLSLKEVTLADAEAKMNNDNGYATIDIPPGFTESVLALGGTPTPSGKSTPLPTIDFLTNGRAGSLGVSLATGVVQPAISEVSKKIGAQVLKPGTASGSASATPTALLEDPVTLESVPFRPLPAHSGVGLTAFYFALLIMMCGFLGATIINSSVDAALGYAPNEVGPRWRQRLPLKITRWQTLLTKWVVAVAIMPLLTGLLLAVAAGVLRMDAPHWWYLWFFAWFTASVVAIGTLVLFAALGSLGQLIALLIFVYLALASSGGTIPLQALASFYRFVANFEPLRQILGGVRAIIYFNSAADAGLSRGFILTTIGLVFWLVVGVGVTTWYDRRGLHRIEPEAMAYARTSARAYHDQHERSGAVASAGASAHAQIP